MYFNSILGEAVLRRKTGEYRLLDALRKLLQTSYLNGHNHNLYPLCHNLLGKKGNWKCHKLNLQDLTYFY